MARNDALLRTAPAWRLRLASGTLYLSICVIVALTCTAKAFTAARIDQSPVWGVYSIIVTAYILSRFVMAWCYRPKFAPGAESYEPAVAIVVPAYNEQEAITETLRGAFAVHYPHDKLRVVVVDDRSSDHTLGRIREFAATCPQLVVVEHAENAGKRQAMATGVRHAGDAEVLVFVDSDSVLEPTALRRMVRYLADPKVGAVAGHTDVLNKDANVLTRMQAVRYFVAFRVYKAAEALFGAVTCCSGCFSAYRRSAVDPVLERWRTQTFLGRQSTYGDDRSLTNYLLPNWRVLYAPDARAHTEVPDRFAKFLRQQLRWKKSWIRESVRAGSFMWRKNPLAAAGFYLGFLLPLIAPQVVLRALVIEPHRLGTWPVWYLGGVLAMATLYGLYYRLHNRERLWYHGILFALFYTAVLVWQFPYALATLRDSKWGTR